MLPDMEFKIEQIALVPGDALLLYTDGTTDALSPDLKPFAEDRLMAVATAPAPSAPGRIQNIMTALDRHIAKREQYDDITLMAVERKA